MDRCLYPQILREAGHQKAYRGTAAEFLDVSVVSLTLALQRHNEGSAKKEELVKDAFGDRVKDMYEIMALATAQESQGRGYGSALVKHVLEKVTFGDCCFGFQ